MTNNKGYCGICADCVPQIDGGSGFNNCEEAHAAQLAEDKTMNNQLTGQPAPVADEELDQLIWGLERYGLYPRLLAALKELRQWRKATVESTTVAEVARAALEYIDALPSDVVAALPAMPGFDRDWANNVLYLASEKPIPALSTPEIIYTCPACNEQSYKDLGSGWLRCADCGEHFTKTEGAQ